MGKVSIPKGERQTHGDEHEPTERDYLNLDEVVVAIEESPGLSVLHHEMYAVDDWFIMFDHITTTLAAAALLCVVRVFDQMEGTDVRLGEGPNPTISIAGLEPVGDASERLRAALDAWGLREKDCGEKRATA